MKNKKTKIIAFILAITLVLGVAIVTSVANEKTTDIQIISDKTTLTAGQTATVSVKVTTNYPVATMSIPVFYDKTLVDVSEATATLTEYNINYATTEKESVDFSRIYAETGLDSNKFGFVLATYIGAAEGDVTATIDSVVLTFKITAKSDVIGSAAIKVVENSAKTNDNVEGMLYFGATTSGTKITDVPENIENITLTNATTSVKIGSDVNSLILNENAPFETLPDKNNNVNGEYTGTIYGFDTIGLNLDMIVDGMITDFVTSQYGDDYVEVIVGDSGFETTGTVINILDDKGNVVESYVYILFGDVDMDGWVGGNDAAMCEFYDANLYGFNSVVEFMAADVDGDAWAGGNDAAMMEYFDANMEMPSQVEIGAVNVNNFYELIIEE